MKTLLHFLFIIACVNLITAQDFAKKFDKYFQAQDLEGQARVLADWEKVAPDNAELIISYFNYFYHKAKSDALTLSAQKPNGESLTMQNSSTGDNAYIGQQTTFDPSDLQEGMDKINQGILIYPDRLDMRFGKIYALGEAQDWNMFTAEIIAAIARSSENNNNWLWTNDLPKEDGKNFFLSAVQSYQNQLYNTGSDALLRNMQEISHAVVQYYPDNVEALSTLSITYLLSGDYDKAILNLTKAEKLAPKDFIVLSNIAKAYELKGDNKNAVKYYKKTLKYGDDQAKAYAQEQINILDKK